MKKKNVEKDIEVVEDVEEVEEEKVSNKKNYFILFIRIGKIMIKNIVFILFVFAGFFNCEILQCLNKKEEKRFVIFVYGKNNCHNYKKNLDSIFCQKYNNYYVIFVDDNSDDGTDKLVKEYIKTRGLENKIKFIINKEFRGKAANQYDAIHQYCDDNDIVLELDSKDWLSHDKVLEYLNEVYSSEPNIWMTYSKYVDYPSGKMENQDYLEYLTFIKSRGEILRLIHDNNPEFYKKRNSNHIPENLIFHDVTETLDKITEIIKKKQKGVYLRFGDGDIFLANGCKDLYQVPLPKLRDEMREAFRLNGPTILKTLPIHCKEISKNASDMYLYMQRSIKEAVVFLRESQILWGEEITDVYSPWSLPFLATKKPNEAIAFLKFLKKSNCRLLVGNKDIPKNIREILFGENCLFVPTPSKNSYSEIDRIEKECLEKINNSDEYKIIIVCMGCSGRALIKRLWPKIKNVFFFDFGSLMDALMGRYVRWWIRHSKFNAKEFLLMLKK